MGLRRWDASAELSLEICLFYGWSKLFKGYLIYLVRGKKTITEDEALILFLVLIMLWNKVIA